MYRIDNPSVVSSLPTPGPPGTPGYFSPGNPASGQAATILDADWANAVQEEICYCITQAGITLSKTSRTQLYQALQAMSVTPPGRLIQVRTFLTPGSTNYTPNPAMNTTRIRMQGAGGGGGGTAATTTPTTSIANGGQGGHYGEAILSKATIGPGPVPIVIGAGGNGGAAGNNNGVAGGLTSFGTGPILQQPGGGYGLGGAVYTGNQSNGWGGLTSPIQTNFLFCRPGGLAHPGTLVWQTNPVASFLTAIMSAGGSSMWSPGAGVSAGGPGQAAGGYGGGGSGNTSAGAEGPFSGGNGSGGAIIIEEYS